MTFSSSMPRPTARGSMATSSTPWAWTRPASSPRATSGWARASSAEFERGVTSSRFTLLVLSPAFLADRWAEFGEGLVSFSAVDEGRNRLLALTLHSCQAPLRLRFRESLDCTDWTRWDEEAARLRRHLDAPEPTIEAVPCPYPGMVPFRKAGRPLLPRPR